MGASLSSGSKGSKLGLGSVALAFLKGQRLLVLPLVVLASFVAGVDVLSVGLVIALVSSLAGPGQAVPVEGVLGAWQQAWEKLAAGREIPMLAAAMILVAIVTFTVRFLYSLTVTALHIRVNAAIKEALLTEMFHMDLLAFQAYRSADLHTYIGPHSNNVGEMINQAITPLPKAFGLLALLALSLSLSVKMTVLSLVLFAAVGLAMRVLFRMQERIGRRFKEAVKQLNFHSLEALQGYKTIRLFSREDFFSQRIRAAFLEVNAIVRRKYILLGLGPSLNEAAALGMAAVILLLFGWLVPGDRSVSVAYLTFFYILLRMTGHASALLNIRAAISVTLPTSRDLLAFLRSQHHRSIPQGSRTTAVLEERLEFRDVGFAYSRADGFALQGINLSVARGQQIGITGVSGSGKSTLVDLLLRVLDPTQGEILLDGIPQREFSLSGWRSLFAVVPQDSFLLNGTLAENIRFGNEALPYEDLCEAARSAMILDFIEELPGGFDTVVGDRGVRLSGGQRQRVAIARALANQRSVIIFDEATSSLDSIAEKSVQASIDNLPEQVTSVMIAHRLSTLRNCDLIAVMQEGAIVEAGTITELTRAGGVFGTLLREQGLHWELGEEPQ